MIMTKFLFLYPKLTGIYSLVFIARGADFPYMGIPFNNWRAVRPTDIPRQDQRPQ